MRARPQAMRHCVTAAVLAAAIAVAGCGPAGGRRELEPLDRSRLSSQLTEVRDAAGRGDRSAAGEALDDFAGEVRRLQRAGALDGPTARALLLGAEQARDRLAVELGPPPAQTQPVEPAPEPRRKPVTPKPAGRPKPPAKEENKEENKEDNKQDEGGSGHDKGQKGGKKH